MKEKFWFTSQGSQIMPYRWFLALEAPWANLPFRGSHVMDDLLGFIAVGPTAANLDALPIGFAKDAERRTKDRGKEFVGLTCAACHTAKLKIGGLSTIVDGAPSNIDFSTFLSWIVDALETTLFEPDKFARFSGSVLGLQATLDAKNALRKELEDQTKELRDRRERNSHTEPYGFGRVDAFGHIMNELLVKNLGIPANRREPNAPVSYPVLWDTPRHDKVQWNGVAPNIGEIGPLLRNIGEVIGVFGDVNVRPRKGSVPIYPSSIKLTELRRLEYWMKSLQSPKWPTSCLPINNESATRGQEIYTRAVSGGGCASCHNLIDRTGTAKFDAVMSPLPITKTDPNMALNFTNRTALTGALAGTPVQVPLLLLGFDVSWGFFKTFGATTSGSEALGNAVLGVFLAGGRDLFEGIVTDPTTLVPAQEVPEALNFVSGMNDQSPKYKARPLNGIWAAAPYLHNGSVPNLEQLLTPPSLRDKQFYVGSRTLDHKKVGLSTDKDPLRSFLFDASKAGNLNTGHDYGTTLNPDEKRDLIEFLKTL